MTIELSDLQRGADWMLGILRKTDNNLEGLEVNVFRGNETKEWRDLKQTVRAWTHTVRFDSSMQIPSVTAIRHQDLDIRAHSLLNKYQTLDPSITGLTLSVNYPSKDGKLERQSVAIGTGYLPPEPANSQVNSIQVEERNLVTDPFGFGTGVAFPS